MNRVRRITVVLLTTIGLLAGPAVLLIDSGNGGAVVADTGHTWA